MISVKSLLNLLRKNKIDFYTGVPDSVLKEFSFSIKNKKHIIAVNEGAAVSIGIGNYLSTGKIPCVYMQNSGLSNAINPLISISDKKVYSIPLVLIIGWRGAPNTNDEPQHNVKGKITKQILKLLNIKYTVVNSDSDLKKFNQQIKYAKKNLSTVACLIKKNTFKKSINITKKKSLYKLDKEYFLKNLLQNLPIKSRIVSSTGYNSRELIFLRKKYNLVDSKDFYMVGGMGHTTSVALGYSLFAKNKTFCIDGDGSLLMHLGSIITAGNFARKNFKYILLNNNSHDSVGGQMTYADNINFKKLSNSLGFKKFFLINNKKNLLKKIKSFINLNSTGFLEVRISNNKIKNLPRPNNLIKIKNQFMKNP